MCYIVIQKAPNQINQQKKPQKVLQAEAQRSVVFTSFTELRSYKELSEPWGGAFGSMCIEQLMNYLFNFDHIK